MTAILLSNDDGIFARGLQTLEAALADLADVWVCAPETEQSAMSHSLSLHRPLRIRQAGDRRFGVDGTPADAVYVAIHHLMKGNPPALVVSGINHGPNLADDVIYSGTVAAAMEGALLGVPAIAFSLASRRVFEFEHAAKFARELVKAALEHTLPPRTLLNVNVPSHGVPDGYEVTRFGRHRYTGDVVEKEDPRGRKYFWIGGSGYEHEPVPGTDVYAVHDLHRISVTPMQLDMTSEPLMAPLKDWRVQGFAQH